MKAFITFNELQNIVRVKTNKPVSLAMGDGTNAVKVGYTVEKKVPLLGIVSKEVTALVTINGIHGMDLDLSYSFGRGVELIVKGIRSFIGEYIEKSNILAWGAQENQVILHIDKIAERLNLESIEKIKNSVSIDNIAIKDNGVEATFSLLLTK